MALSLQLKDSDLEVTCKEVQVKMNSVIKGNILENQGWKMKVENRKNQGSKKHSSRVRTARYYGTQDF